MGCSLHPAGQALMQLDEYLKCREVSIASHATARSLRGCGDSATKSVRSHCREVLCGLGGSARGRLRGGSGRPCAPPHHRLSRTGRIAGLSGFLTLIQSRDAPDRWGALSRFDTMPSNPSLQACRNTVAPSSSVCSLRARPPPASAPAASPASPCGHRAASYSSRSNAYRIASLALSRRWSASKTATPSGPQTTARKIAASLGVGTGTVQRIKAGMSA
jgi:hypothetical protein